MKSDMHATTGWTWEPETEPYRCYEFEIGGVCVPYAPATWNDPPEGGQVEDLTVKLLSATNNDGEEIELTANQFAEITAAFENELATNDALRKRIEEQLRQNAADHDEYLREEAAERAAEVRRERRYSDAS
jgi:hypothetical protein